MARFGLENIDRDFFWELVDEGYASYSIIDAYLYMLSQKLSKDTDIHFRVENGVIKRLTKNQKKISNAFRNTTKSKTITVKKKE